MTYGYKIAKDLFWSWATIYGLAWWLCLFAITTYYAFTKWNRDWGFVIAALSCVSASLYGILLVAGTFPLYSRDRIPFAAGILVVVYWAVFWRWDRARTHRVMDTEETGAKQSLRILLK